MAFERGPGGCRHGPRSGAGEPRGRAWPGGGRWRGAAAVALVSLALAAPACPPRASAQERPQAPSRTAGGARLAGIEATVPAPAAPGLGAVGRHRVGAGESLASIAARYGLGPVDLARLNAVTASSVLLPGRDLWVPLPAAVSAESAPTGAEAASVGAQPGSAGAGRYLVGRGDTLYGVARRFGVSVEDLRRWNGIADDGRLLAGQELWLTAPPGSRPRGQAADTQSVHVVAPGDTLSSIAVRYDTSVGQLQRGNGLVGETIWIGQRLSVPRGGTGLEGATPGGPKSIEVVVGEQRMYVWQGDDLVWSWPVSTGIATHPTQRGRFAVQSKIANAWSSAWQLWMPHWLGIYWAGSSENGIHALPIINGQTLWAGSLGSPVSYGCVVLGSYEAALLYGWAEIGTPVVIRD